MSMGSNILGQGIYTLLDDIVKYLPQSGGDGNMPVSI